MKPDPQGYYKWNDVVFVWKDLLPDTGEGNPLGALTYHDSLVHKDHPLRMKGKDGIELYIGTYKEGKTRLMFSAPQVEYLRYWIHAMGLTKKIIPILNSTYLVKASELDDVLPQVYKEGAKLKKAAKQVERIGKGLAGANPTLLTLRKTFESARACLTESTKQDSTWIAIDFENWEYENDLVTEYGFSIVRFRSGEESKENGHIIVEENKIYWNGKFVPNNQQNYNFGESRVVPFAKVNEEINELISTSAESNPLYLIFHDRKHDVKLLLDKFQAPLERAAKADFPDKPPKYGTYILDTAQLFAALEGDIAINDDAYTYNKRRSLERVCALLGVRTEYLHNAGNDAHYTMLACMEMLKGDPVDVQIKKRWPSRTVERGKVKFEKWEDLGSDYDSD